MKKIIFIFVFLAFASTIIADSFIVTFPRQDTINVQFKRQIINSIDSSIKIQTEINSSVNSLSKPKERQPCSLCSLLGSIIGAFITGGVAILVFILGRRKEKRQETKRIRGFGDQLLNLTNHLTIKYDKQIDSIKLFIKTTKEQPHKINSLNIHEYGLSDRIRSFNSTLVYDAFRTLGLETDDFSKFYNNLDYLNEVIKSLFQDYRRNNDQIGDLAQEFIKTRIELLNNIAAFVENQRLANNLNDKLYIYLNEILIKYHSLTKPQEVDLKSDMDELINPLKNEFITNFREYSLYPVLVHQLQKCGNLYRTIINLNQNLVGDFEKIIENIRSSNNKIKDIYKRYKQ